MNVVAAAERALLGAVLAAAVCALAPGAGAQPLPLGSEFQVNQTSADVQRGPAAAVDGQGAFVVVWRARYQDGSDFAVFARRFDSAGVAQGAEFQVNSYTEGSQFDGAVSRTAGGAFVVVWTSEEQDGSLSGIFARRFDSAGVAQGAELRVNSYTSAQQVQPLVAIGNDGRFVVVWGSYDQDGSHFGAFGQRFGSSGVAEGAEFRINAFTAEDQFPTGLALDDAGRFVVAWASRGQDGSEYGVFAKRFASDGTALAAEFQVNTVTSGAQLGPAVAMAGSGEFVVAWDTYPSGGGPDYTIVAQRFDSAGLAQGAELKVNSSGDDNSKGSVAAGMDDGGDFVVSWNGDDEDGAGDGVFAQQFAASAARQGSEFQVNSHTVDDQARPSVAMTGSGKFVVAWESTLQDGSEEGVFARRFGAVITLDVDGDGLFLPLTDGLLVVRYGFGFRGATLVNGAVAADCSRCTAPVIETYLAGIAN